MKHMSVPMEIKTLDEKGLISGYASIFGTVDLGGDIIVKEEPFKEIERNPDGKVLMLFSHDSGAGWSTTAAGGIPVGLADVQQNSKGLKFDGQLVMDDAFVRERLYPGLKARTICEMSIGYDVLPGGGRILESGLRELSAMKLWEISPVIWGMNRRASIDAVKAIPQFETIRECEVWLRDEARLTNSAAKEFVVRFKKALTRDESTRDESEAKAMERSLQFLNSLSKETA